MLKNLGGTFDFDQYLWIQELNAKTEDIEFVDVEGDGDLDLFLGNSNNDSRLYLEREMEPSQIRHIGSMIIQVLFKTLNLAILMVMVIKTSR